VALLAHWTVPSARRLCFHPVNLGSVSTVTHMRY